MILGTIFTVSLSMIFIVFDRFFAGIFTSNPKIVELATIRMTYILIFEVLNINELDYIDNLIKCVSRLDEWADVSDKFISKFSK